MKTRCRSTLLLASILAVPLLASVIAGTGRKSDSLPAVAQAGELPAADSEDSKNRLPSTQLSTSTLASDIPVSISRPAPSKDFDVFKVKTRKSISELESRLGPDAFTATLKINRIDKKHIRVGDLLVIPNASADLVNLAPFPNELAAARTIPKLLLVSRRVQAFGAYESGKLVRWGPTSTGKKSTPTPAGLYHTNWKAKTTRSSVNASWVLPWCFNLDNFSGVSFHQFDLPGYPASHGCVRLLEEDAKWIYDWAEQWKLSNTDRFLLAVGTPVIIFGDYSYGEKPLWKRLADDPSASAISIAESETALNQHLATIDTKARPSVTAPD